MGREEVPGFSIDQEGVLWYNGRLCVPNIEELKQLILKETHDTPYLIHPGGTKMYRDLKEQFWCVVISPVKDDDPCAFLC
jgi:hypothetical protein